MTARQAFHLNMPETAADHTIGPQESLVTVVEYGDFECPHCKQAAPAVKLLLNRFAGRIRFVYRHFPLEEVHPHALRAAETAESAGAQGLFWPMHDLLYDNQSDLEGDDLRSYAERLRLDMTRYATDMNDHVYLRHIRENEQSGSESGVRSTPTFFINRSILDVSFGLTQLFEAVGDLLASSRLPKRK
jgi:protein-disulfide isomerase